VSGPPPLDTRRALVRGAAAGSLVLLLGGARGASAQLGGDRVIVAAALEVEQALLRLYRGASTGAPNIDERAIARRFADQQREHVVTLSAVLGRRAASGDDAEDGGEGGFLRQAILLEE